MTIGILAGLAANALWAMAFLTPYFSTSLSGADFSFLRFLFYGMFAAVLVGHLRLRGVRLSGRAAVKASILGAVGYALSFILVYCSVNLAGGVTAALLMGLVPVVFSIGSNLRRRSVPWPPLLTAAAIILVGMVTLRWRAGSMASAAPIWSASTGILCGLGAMASWGFFIVFGGGSGRDTPDVGHGLLEVAWIGIGAFLGSVVILVPFLALGQSALPTLWGSARWDWHPVALAAFMGLFSTWIATWLWGVCAGRLSRAACTQLAASETLFAVVYSLIYERRAPSLYTASGSALVIIGILLTLAMPQIVAKVADEA